MTDHGQDETTFSTTGGAGSIRYTLGEVSAAGVKLARIAEQMEPLLDRLRSEWQWLGAAAHGTAPYPSLALDSMRLGVWTCMRVQADTATLAQKAIDAAKVYDAAEAHNAALTAQAVRFKALAAGSQTWNCGPLAPLKLLADAFGIWRGAKENGLRDTSEFVLNSGPAYGAGLLGPGISIPYMLTHLQAPSPEDSGVVPAYVLRKTFDWLGLSKPGKLVVRQVPPEQWHAPSPQWRPGQVTLDSAEGLPGLLDPTISGLLRGSKDAYGYPPGSIGVSRVDRPDGTRAWIVHLPGTEDWSTLDSVNPWDLEGDLEGITAAQKEAFAQRQIVIQELMKAALKAAGALPTEDVMITGHSGGGIHAGGAGADPAFLADVNIKMLVIVGAPTKNLHVGPGIEVLDIENENDLITSVDFGPPPDSPDWVTVTTRRPGGDDGAKLFDVVKDGHDLNNYIDDAEQMENSDNPAIQKFRDDVRKFLGQGIPGGPIKVRKFVFQGLDVNDPSSAKMVKSPGKQEVHSQKQGTKKKPVASAGVKEC